MGDLGNVDLECCGFLDLMPNIFFLGVEYPPQLRLLDIDKGEVVHKIDLLGMNATAASGTVKPTFA